MPIYRVKLNVSRSKKVVVEADNPELARAIAEGQEESSHAVSWEEIDEEEIDENALGD